MFDLNLLYLNFIDGLEQPALPGLFTASPPRRTARGRNGDQLVLQLTLLGSAPLSPTGYESLLGKMAEVFYQKSGSVTAALRATAESLNEYLLERNLKNTTLGKQSLGLLNLAVIHGATLYLAQSGPTHAYLLGDSTVVHMHDPQLAGRGLGLSRTTQVRYFQEGIHPGDYLLVCPEPPLSWSEKSLAGSKNIALEHLRRRLLNQAPQSFSAALIQMVEGNGKTTVLRTPGAATRLPAPTVTPPVSVPSEAGVESPALPDSRAEEPVELSGTEIETPAEPEQVPEFQTISEVEAIPDPIPAVEEIPSVESVVEADIPPLEPAFSTRVPSDYSSPPEGLPDLDAPRPAVKPVFVSPAVEENTPAPVVKPQSLTHPRSRRTAQGNPAIRDSLTHFLQGAARFLRWSRKTRTDVTEKMGTLGGRLAPESGDSRLALSNGVMLFIAIAVPVIVVTIATMVYFQRGRARIAMDYFNQAQAAAVQTVNQSDPVKLRESWSQSLYLLDQADKYILTDESKALREQAQRSLDELDGIRPVDVQPAIIGRLSDGIKITRMIASSTDLFLLDGASGRVLRAILTGNGYEMDPQFNCGPGTTGSLIIGPIIDIVPVPKGNPFNADVMGIDGNGNLVYCAAGLPITSATLAPPDINWGKIAAVKMDGNQLYILDPVTNRIWVYDEDQGAFSTRPRPFFGDQVPPMSDTVDLAIANETLYLLHTDGHLSRCTFSSLSFEPTRCEDEVAYSDPRPGRDSSPTRFIDAVFSQTMTTSLPTPALYMLDPTSKSVYLFSLQLKLQYQLRPLPSADYPLPDANATAFTISTNRMFFMAMDNLVYYGALP